MGTDGWRRFRNRRIFAKWVGVCEGAARWGGKLTGRKSAGGVWHKVGDVGQGDFWAVADVPFPIG